MRIRSRNRQCQRPRRIIMAVIIDRGRQWHGCTSCDWRTRPTRRSAAAPACAHIIRNYSSTRADRKITDSNRSLRCAHRLDTEASSVAENFCPEGSKQIQCMFKTCRIGLYFTTTQAQIHCNREVPTRTTTSPVVIRYVDRATESCYRPTCTDRSRRSVDHCDEILADSQSYC